MSNIQKVRDFFEESRGMKGFIFAILTDKILCDKWPLTGTVESDYDERLVLEIRVFNDECEHKLFRSAMGQPYKYRALKDDKESLDINKICDYYDEKQYLDIDTTKLPDQDKANLLKVQATGGGQYYLPLVAQISNGDNPLKELEYAVLKVRHYISKYEETGKAYVKDWRCLGFEKGGKRNG